MIEVYKFILTDILPQLNSKNMKLILDFESNTVGTGELECSGYFDDDEKELVVAVGDKKVEEFIGAYDGKLRLTSGHHTLKIRGDTKDVSRHDEVFHGTIVSVDIPYEKLSN